MAVTALDALAVEADRVGVIVELLTAAEPGLDRAAAKRTVHGVAGGRAKRRRLAQALLANPAVLANGRSPAPRVVGDLLIAIRRAGAVHIAAPVCAGCGKPLRTLQRRGEDWYCGACGPRREACAGCGTTRPVSIRDRDGRPRCARCPPADGPDPVQLVVRIVADVDPALPTDVVVTAVRAVATRAGQRHQLGWALQERPDLLTGAGAEAPVPSVLRLIDRLCAAGSTGVVRPPCPHCGQVLALVKRRAGVRLCRNCVAKSRAEPCGRCGVVREPTTRDEDGRPVCPHCWITDPANQETCTGCHRRRPISVRTPAGPLCGTCRPVPLMTCSICDRRAPCLISQTTGQPCCRALPAALGAVCRLRPGSTDPRRHPHRAPLLNLHPPGSGLLAQLLDLRTTRPHLRRPVRPLPAG